MSENRLNLTVKLGPGRLATASYAMGSFGTGVFSTVPSILLLFYCTETLGLPPTPVAIILLVPKLLSILWDPYVGSWSDGTRGRWGRRRPFLAIGAIGTAVAFAALFAPPELAKPTLLAWVALTYFALTALYSLFAVPYTAIPAQIAPDEGATLKLVGARIMVLMIGILAGAALAPILVAQFGGGRVGYAAMGICIAVASAAAMLSPLIMLRSYDGAAAGHATRPTFSDLLAHIRSVLNNRSFRDLLGIFLLQVTAYGGFSAAIPYVITGKLGFGEEEIGIALGVVIVASFMAVPLWTWLGHKIGYIWSIALSASGYALAALAIALAIFAEQNWTTILIFFAMGGAFFSGLQVLPFSLAADIVRRTAPAQEAKFAGLWIAMEKAGLAAGAAILALLLPLGDNSLVATLFLGGLPLLLMTAAVIQLLYKRPV